LFLFGCNILLTVPVPDFVGSAAECAESKTMKAKKTILCVDDHEQSLSIRKLILETRGYRVIACTTGEQALEAFRAGGVDLVLTDLVMPGMSGNDLVEHIKQISPATPIILFSGQVKMYDQNTLADIFLPKGMYSAAELLERIRLMLVHKRGPKRALVPGGLQRASGS